MRVNLTTMQFSPGTRDMGTFRLEWEQGTWEHSGWSGNKGHGNVQVGVGISISTVRGVVDELMFSRCWWTSSGTGSCRASRRAHRSSATIRRQIGDLGVLCVCECG